MARSPDVLQDTTPLDAAHVDVPVRVAWLLRISRAVGDAEGHLTVTDMASRLKERGIAASAPSVSGWETGRVAPGPAVIEGYEAVLGREPGTLRGAVDMTRRTFRHCRPRSSSATPGLAELDDLCDRVGSSSVAGIDWLHFCEAALTVRPGLPRTVVRPLVERLLSELGRSVFTGYVTRYEGLAMLRCGQYADLVLDAARAHVDEPGVQVAADVLSLVAEHPDAAAVRLVAGYLGDDSPVRARAAVLGLENALGVPDLPQSHLAHVVTPLAEALRTHGDDPGRRPMLHGLWRGLPAPLRDEVRRATPGPDPVRVAPDPHERDRRVAAVEMSQSVAGRVCARAGVRPEPLMARLLYEAAFDSRHTRSFTSMLLLMASPLRALLAEELAAVADRAPEPGEGVHHATVREEATDLLVGLGHRESARRATTWLDSPDDDRVCRALVTLAHAAHELPEPQLAELVERPGAVGQRALYHAGMTAHPLLKPLAERTDHPLAPGARWWLRQGPVVER